MRLVNNERPSALGHSLSANMIGLTALRLKPKTDPAAPWRPTALWPFFAPPSSIFEPTQCVPIFDVWGRFKKIEDGGAKMTESRRAPGDFSCTGDVEA